MKKIFALILMAFTMATGLFADVRLVPEDAFNNYIAPVYEDLSFIQPQIAYVADTWEDVYEKTGVNKYGWMDINSTYCGTTEHSFFLIIKCKVRGGLGWICFEYPGDGSSVFYVADAY